MSTPRYSAYHRPSRSGSTLRRKTPPMPVTRSTPRDYGPPTPAPRPSAPRAPPDQRVRAHGMIGAVGLGIADHFGWAIAVTASADHEVVDRRRIELIEPGLPAGPVHYQGKRLDVPPAAPALAAKVRASVVRATSAALDEIAAAVPEPVVSISLRAWPPDFPDDI